MISLTYGSFALSLIIVVFVWEVIAQLINQSKAFVTDTKHTESTWSAKLTTKILEKSVSFSFVGFMISYMYTAGCVIIAIVYNIDPTLACIQPFPMILDCIIISIGVFYCLLLLVRKYYRKHNQ